jgi:hypothetical protein
MTYRKVFCRSHLALEDDDPALGEKFSTATLQQGTGHGAIPSRVHGAPTTAAESREVLARLKRMAGFESQDFDPAVLIQLSYHAPASGCDTLDVHQ